MIPLDQLLPASTVVRVYLLGPLDLWKKDPTGTWTSVPKDLWQSSKPARSIFKRLLVQPARRLTRGALEEDIWADADNGTLTTKQVYNAISLIRGILGKTLVTCEDTAYAIAGQTLVWTDLDACAALLTNAENQGWGAPATLPLLERALTLLNRGDLLEGEDGTWCYAFRKRADDMRIQCRVWLADQYEAQGKLWQAAEQYRAILLHDPTAEDALERWIAMLHRHGQIREAIRCYRETKACVEALGFALSPAFEHLVTQLEEQQAIRPCPTASCLLPTPSGPLWHPDPAHPEFLPRFVAWSTLLPIDREATPEDATCWASLEGEILAKALCWRPSSGPLTLLQQLTYNAIRKQETMHTHHPDPHHDVTRRQALQAIACFPLQLYGLTHMPAAQVPPDELIALCAAGLTACIEIRKHGPEGRRIASRTLAGYLPTLEHLAHQSRPWSTSAARLAAQGYLLVSILADYSRRLDQMEAACRMARLYAQIAHDPNLEAMALNRLAVKFDYEHRDHQSLETYQEALALPGFAQLTSLLQSRVYVGLAATHAYCQQPAPALSFLSQAKDCYPDAPDTDPSYALAHSTPGEFTMWTGLVLKHTHQYAQAAETFARFGRLEPVDGLLEANRAEHLNYAASVAVKQRELDTACWYLAAAEEVAWTQRHHQRLAEVHSTFSDIQLLWPHESRVQQLHEQLAARQN